jgi:hypothetical protein
MRRLAWDIAGEISSGWKSLDGDAESEDRDDDVALTKGVCCD